jgi:hypothetical protein
LQKTGRSKNIGTTQICAAVQRKIYCKRHVCSDEDQRISILPDNTNYEVVIDVRGQEWTQDMLDDIVTRITQRTNGEVTVSFMK